MRISLAAIAAATACAFDWTNDKVTACVRDRDNWPSAWLNTENAQSYMCTREQVNQYYDPANLACWQSDAQNPTGDVASGRCPAEGTTVQCLLQAGWGQIAGNCDACDKAECSRKGLSGAESCAALACTDSPGFLGAGAGTKCQGNAWKDGPSPYDPAHADGYCDCAPDCADCDGPGPADGALGVTSSSCDARNGTAPASDWANCWNSCVDCMGDDLSHQGIAKYMPEAMGQQIVGTANWTTYNVGHYNGTGTWWLCKTDSPTQKGDCAWMGKADGLPMGPKFKGLALCA